MPRATGFCVALAFTILPPGAFASLHVGQRTDDAGAVKARRGPTHPGTT